MSESVRVYAYKAKPPSDGLDLVMDQFRLAHRYKNKLVEVELARRSAVDAARRARFPEILTLENRLTAIQAEIDGAETVIKANNSRQRARAADPEAAAALKALRRAREDLRDQLKMASKEAFADQDFREGLVGISAANHAARKEAYAEFGDLGLAWGTRGIINQAMRDISKGKPPRFHRWTGKGSIAVQIQKGMDWTEAILSQDSCVRVEIQPRPNALNPAARRAANRTKALVRFRVGSAGPANRIPIWVTIPIHLHRQPPEGARVKWVRLHRWVVGRQVKWEVQFILAREDWDKADTAGAGEAGIDVNWRALPAGIRVAYLIGDDGTEESLTIPRAWLAGWERSESLQSIRDRNFDAARARLVDWMKARPDVPEWFADRLAHLVRWRHIDRLTRVVWLWKDQRFDGDEEVFAEMEAWRKQDRHLHDWQDHQYKKMVRRRNLLYREFASLVRRRFHTVRLEKINWKELNARPAVEDPADTLIRMYSRIAAPGILQQYIREAVANPLNVPPAGTTKVCHSCGSSEEFDHARLVHTCSACGTTWDQDRNAAINILNHPDAVPCVRGQVAVEDADAAR